MITYFCEKNVTVNVQCLGNVNKIFFLQLIGTKKSINIEINDNFHDQSVESIKFLKQAGFSLKEKRHAEEFNTGPAEFIFNQIWVK